MSIYNFDKWVSNYPPYLFHRYFLPEYDHNENSFDESR